MVDIHAHLAYKDFFSNEFIEGISENTYEQLNEETKNVTSQSFLKKVVLNNLLDKDGSKLINQMDNAGIDKSVLLVVDFYYGKTGHVLSLEEIHKKHYEISQKWDGRFILFSGIDPRRGSDGLELFEKCIVDYNFRGLKLYPPCGFELDEEILYPYYEICNHYNISVLTHIGPSIKTMKNNFNFPESVLRAAEIFKNVQFILGHAGVLFFEQSLPLCKDRPNVNVDVSGFQLLKNNQPYLEQCMMEFFNSAPEQILFGTDWPMFNLNGTQKSWVDYFAKMDKITSRDLERFFSGNALRILNNCRIKTERNV